MENKRAYRSGRVSLWQDKSYEELRRGTAGFAPIVVTAAVSVFALLAVLGWQATETIKSRDEATHFVAERPAKAIVGTVSAEQQNLSRTNDGATLPDNASSIANSPAKSAAPAPNDFSQIGNNVAAELAYTYSTLVQSGAYTPAQGEKIASNIASSLSAEVTYTPSAESDFKTDPDTSYKRMLAYRADLRTALEPLIVNTEPEIGIFGRYIESHDRKNLTRLGEVAGRYKKAGANLKQVVAPKDAISYHAAVANSLLRFAATLEAMVKNVDDSIATLALLRTYNSAEQDVLTSFNSLASYQKNKTP